MKIKICIIWFIVSLTILSACQQKRPDKPNILFISTDYQAWEDIPAIESVLQMPVLDRLSKEGVVMHNHYCTAPICMPSRYSIVSGRYPHYHQMWDNGVDWLPDGTPIIMDELKKLGYYTVGIGKMHFKPYDRMAGYEKRIIADGKKNSIRDTALNDDYARYLAKASLTRWDYLKYQDSTAIYGVYDWPFADSLHIDAYVGNQAARFIDQDSLPEPWFLWVSFCGPHNPWDPPERYSAMYLNTELPKARYYPGELSSKPTDHTRVRYNYTPRVPKYMEAFPDRIDSILQRIRAGHFGNLTFIDDQLGKVINQLKQRNGLKKTAIIFTSDHGTHLGDHENIHKGTHYERSAHVPFIVWYPDFVSPGKIDGFSTHIDLMPTLISLAGGVPETELEGYDMWPLITGEVEKIQDHVFTEIRHSVSIVNNQYKLGIYPRDSQADFYDLEVDPDELFNRFYDPNYQGIIDSLLSIIREFSPDDLGVFNKYGGNNLSN